MQNLSLIVALVLVQSLFAPYLSHVPVAVRKVIDGLAFGLVAIIAMLLPVVVADGVQIDPKGIVVLLATISGGPLTGLIAATLGAGFRLYLGGLGGPPGAALVLASWLMGWFFSFALRRGVHEMTAMSWLLAGVALGELALVCTLLLPADTRELIFRQFAIPVLIYYPISTFVVGAVFSLDAERRLAAAELAASDQRYRSLVEHAPDAIIVHQDGKVVYSNPQAVRLLHASSEMDLLGRQTTTLLHPDYHEAMRERIATMHRTGEHAPPMIEKCIRLDGDLVDVEITGTICQYQGKPAVQVLARDITRRLRMEQRLQRQRDRLSLAVDAAELAISDLNIEKQTIRRNARAAAMFGDAPRRQAGGLGELLAHVHEEDLAQVMDVVERAIEADSTFSVEYRLKARNRHTLWVRSFGRLIRRSPAVEKLLVIATQDVTVAKEAEGALRESEQRLDLAIHGADLGIWDWNMVSGEVFFSDRWMTMLGYEAGDLPPTFESWYSLIHPEDVDRVMRGWKEHEAGHSSIYSVEHRLRTKSESWKWVLGQGRVVKRDARGKPIRAVGTHLDIDIRKRAETRIAESEERARRYFNLGLIGMATTSPSKGWVEVNDELCRMLGYTREELSTTTWADLTHPEDLDLDVSEFNRVLSGESTGYTIEKRYIRKDGSVVHANISVAATYEDDGSVQHCIALVRDISERKEAERHRKLMLSELDHRVKNNLATVLAILDQTQAGATDIDQFTSVFRGRIRALARMHEALARSHWRGVSMQEVAALVLAPFAQGEDVRVRFGGDPLTLATRSCLPMSMTLHELLTNATKYGALSVPDGSVEVHWQLNDGKNMRLTWQERGGPTVQTPTRRGNGTELIEGLVTYELQGQVKLTYEPAGVECVIDFPVLIAAGGESIAR